MLAPWELFEPHRTRPYAFFLDRAEAGAWSFAGSEPTAQLVVERDGRCRRWNGRRWLAIRAHPVESIERFVQDSACEPPGVLGPEITTALPRTVGYIGYELGAFVENVQAVAADPVAVPLAVLSTYDRVDAWHARLRRPIRIELAPRKGRWRARHVPARDDAPAADLGGYDERAALAGYRLGFARIKNAIGAGEIYQANLARHIRVPLQDEPACVYRRLRRRQPVPRGAYLDTGACALLSNSPECFLRIDGARIATYPIKGTRPSTDAPGDDQRMRNELAGDPKELAEHVMIVDLERNDLGRICRTGTVEVAAYAEVQSFDTVHHLVSEVTGTLRDGTDLAEILRATFPGGSITGAPKVKAMEIIAEVEPVARGVYTGAIGCFNGSRSVDLSIAIRTAVVARGLAHYGTGGGIVADSTLASELDETTTKARAFLESIVDGRARRAGGLTKTVGGRARGKAAAS